MDLWLLTWRILHIASGVFWVGAARFFFGFVGPTANALGPESQKFMHHLSLLHRVRQLDALLLLIAVLWMAMGRYLG